MSVLNHPQFYWITSDFTVIRIFHTVINLFSGFLKACYIASYPNFFPCSCLITRLNRTPSISSWKNCHSFLFVVASVPSDSTAEEIHLSHPAWKHFDLRGRGGRRLPDWNVPSLLYHFHNIYNYIICIFWKLLREFHTICKMFYTTFPSNYSLERILLSFSIILLNVLL